MLAELQSCSWNETSCIYFFNLRHADLLTPSGTLGVKWDEKTGPVIVSKCGYEISLDEDFKQRFFKATEIDKFMNWNAK